MLGRTVLALSAVLMLLMPALVRAQDCPAEGSGWEGREDAVRKAPTCNQAFKVAEACAYGATGDTGLTNIVIEKCEADFLAKLSTAQRKTYKAEIKRCDAKARGGHEGTMYISFAAFCRAGVAQRTAAKFAKAPQRK